MKRVRNISTPELQFDEKIRILTSRLRKLEKVKLAHVDNQQYEKAAGIRTQIFKLKEEVFLLSTQNSLRLMSINGYLPDPRMQFPLRYDRSTGYIIDSKYNKIAKICTNVSHDDMILLAYWTNQTFHKFLNKKITKNKK